MWLARASTGHYTLHHQKPFLSSEYFWLNNDRYAPFGDYGLQLCQQDLHAACPEIAALNITPLDNPIEVHIYLTPTKGASK